MTPTLLITGAAGSVGSALRPLLRRHYTLRLLDRHPIAETVENEHAIACDLTDRNAVLAAVAGADAIVHLACAHGPAIRYDETVEPNYHATLYLLEAAQRHAVSRFVFASSHHVLGQYRGDEVERFDDLPAAPDSY
ncbi:MAG: Uronate dehydrogenase [Paracidovorax wautersii]|uniref:Uronate dehydrogenase n=1 Tax=Paracidovorax wautersii TaxID=1177982 RepID=A0A7V8FMY6_9BURK|nr:MAG: Uronate dehydrogenase [Paracidovorax wautersii]